MIDGRFQLLIRKVVNALNESGVHYAILRNTENFPVIESRDLDVGLTESALNHFLPIFKGVLISNDFTIVKYSTRYRYHKYVIADSGAKTQFFQIDFFCWESMYGLEILPNPDSITLFDQELKLRRFTTEGEVASIVLSGALRGRIKSRYISRIRAVQNESTERSSVLALLGDAFIMGNTQDLLCAFSGSDSIRWHKKIFWRISFLNKNLFNRPVQTLKNIFLFAIEHARTFLWPQGKLITFLGPDGSGKSSVAAIVESHVNAGLFTEVVYFHGSIPILPRLALFKDLLTGNSKEIESNDQNDRLIQQLTGVRYKFIYLFYYALNGLLSRPYVRYLKWRNRLIILDRYYYDYYFQNGYRWESFRLLNMLVKLIPQPDLTIYLKNTADVLFSRKPEVVLSEISRQVSIIDECLPFFANVEIVETDAPLSNVAEKVTELLCAE